MIKRFLLVLIAILVTFAIVQAGAKNPTMSCQPKVIKFGQSLVITMSLPHGKELGVQTPDNRFLFIAFEPEPYASAPIIPSSEFKSMRQLKLDATSAVGLPRIGAGASQEQIFKTAGKYTFIVSNNLETEDETGVNLVCKVELTK